MGKSISKKGGNMKQQQLDSWKDGKNSTWYMTINETEVKAQLLRKRFKTEEKLKDETTKQRKLQSEVDIILYKSMQYAYKKYFRCIALIHMHCWNSSPSIHPLLEFIPYIVPGISP